MSEWGKRGIQHQTNPADSGCIEAQMCFELNANNDSANMLMVGKCNVYHVHHLSLLC